MNTLSSPIHARNRPVQTAASIRITGKVTDEKGESFPGANVSIKGTTRGVVTNGQGDLNIDVSDENSLLVVSFIGYQTQEIPVGKQTSLSVSLAPNANSLNEVVAVGPIPGNTGALKYGLKSRLLANHLDEREKFPAEEMASLWRD
ncbi:carboxypeptidase-like regulatory domain-containing protein [Spirosoma aureum]|nr:carboxypeptidase-like regulatory domain-containing protein [Spirosoma aureum]